MAQTGTGLVKVDDRDARITYSPVNAWATGGQADEYDGTTTYTLAGYASFTFSFQGTSLQVIGTLDGTTTPPTGAFTYQIDGGTALLRSAQTVSGTRTPGVVLVQMDNIAAGQHTLVVTNSGPGSSKFVLDEITYTPSSASNGTDSGGGGSNSGDGGGGGGNGGAPSPSVNVGAIAGGVVGGILGLGLIAFLAIYAWRRRREANVFMDEHRDYVGKHPASPPPHPSVPPAYQPNGLAVLSHSPGPRSDVMSHASSSPPPTTVSSGPAQSQLPYDPSPLRFLDQHQPNGSQSNLPFNPYSR